MHVMYSREIVDKALKLRSLGWTQQHIALACGVSQAAVSHWINGTRRSPATEAKRANRTSYCPRCSEGTLHEEAYAYVLGAYLGDGHITEGRRGVHALSIFHDKKHPQIIAYCRAAIEAVFPVGVFLVHRIGCIEIKATSKHWTCVFPQHGKGHKHSRPIVLKPWQQDIVDAYPEMLVRGLIHSDGCRTNNRIRKRNGQGHYEYPRYHFTNTSTDIIEILTHALDRLGIAWKVHIGKKEPHHRDTHIVSISRKEAVATMERLVGPKY
jgi:hypothetical protein